MFAEQARKHVPERKTYAIRIFSRDPQYNGGYGQLKNSENYVAIKEYRFDDIDSLPLADDDPFQPITDKIARKIIQDFKPHRDSIEELLVHCKAGMSRSPAVAKALNEIFKLGNKKDFLDYDYPNLNEYVYYIMMNNRDAAKSN